jgi:hypothetical protein
MGSVYKIITPVATEPIALADAKSYLRVDFTDDDTLIGNLITRVRSFAEEVTGRALATQTIQQIDTIARPDGGVLSGPIKPGPNWYIYNEQLGANPFGPAQYYHDLARPPFQSMTSVQTKVTAFDDWTNYDLTVYSTWIDDTSEPARMYFQDPLTVNFWQFTFVCGYSNSYPIPSDILQPMYEAIAYWYQFREAQDLPQALVNKFLMRRVDWV